jgi:uncharacterized protein (DUF433 family)
MKFPSNHPSTLPIITDFPRDSKETMTRGVWCWHQIPDRIEGRLLEMDEPMSMIVKTPGVCGGVARIIRTRIPVWTLERIRQFNVSESEILRSYPTLRAVDLVQAWSYADSHRDEIETQTRENEED